ncbi:unnamed protein product [Clavelina lepadiformis]|uniref:Uncharacterized protein n=1 Tax=Clavelina lepadiformis TaxID=159417 RepID=A0ABP0FN48_CLALP
MDKNTTKDHASDEEIVQNNPQQSTITEYLDKLESYLNQLIDTSSLNPDLKPILKKFVQLTNLESEESLSVSNLIADAGGVKTLYGYLEVLGYKDGNYLAEDCEIFEAVRDVLWGGTDKSETFCEECRKCGVFDLLVKDLKYFKDSFNQDRNSNGFIVFQAMVILYNCAKFQDNLNYLIHLDIVELLKHYSRNATNVKIRNWSCLDVISSVLLASIVNEEEQQSDFMVVDDHILKYLVENLQLSVDAEKHRWNGMSTKEVLTNLLLLTKNDKNCLNLLRVSNILRSLNHVLTKGTYDEKYTALKLLQNFTRVQQGIEYIQLSASLRYNLDLISTNPEHKSLQSLSGQIISSLKNDASPDPLMELQQSLSKMKKDSSNIVSTKGSMAMKKFVEAHLQTLTIQFTELEQTGILNEDIIKNFFLLYLNVSPGDGVIVANRQAVASEIVDKKGVVLFMRYLQYLTKNHTIFPQTDINAKCLEMICDICWNASNVSRKYCDECVRCNLITAFAANLRNIEPTFQDDLSKQGHHVVQAINILHNFAKAGIDKHHFQKVVGLTNLISRFKQNCRNLRMTNHAEFPVICHFLLAYLVDKDGCDIISAELAVIQYITQNLQIALADDVHSFEGFSAEELVSGLNQLAKNAENSVAILSENNLPSLTLMIEKGSQDEQTAATSLVCALASFADNKSKILSYQPIMDALRNLANKPGTSNEKLQRNLVMALFVLKENHTDEQTEIAGNVTQLYPDLISSPGVGSQAELSKELAISGYGAENAEKSILAYIESLPASVMDDIRIKQLTLLLNGLRNPLKDKIYWRPPIHIDYALQTTAMVGYNGTSIELGGCKINIPSGAVMSNFPVLFSFSLCYGKDRDQDPNTFKLTPTLECSPTSEFRKPVTIQLPSCYFPSTDVTVTPRTSHDGQSWQNLEQVKHDVGKSSVISFETTNFSWFDVVTDYVKRKMFTKQLYHVCYLNPNTSNDPVLVWELKDDVMTDDSKLQVGEAFKENFKFL